MIKLTDEPTLIEKLHLAYSRDGLHWTALNGNRPVLELPPPFHLMRDPFLQRGADGMFHLVGTGGPGPSDIAYVRSTDLITWEEPRSLPVMASVQGTKNAWAPEFVYDEASGTYVLFWSSSQARFGWEESRIWCCRTPDFVQITAPHVLFDPGFSVIDATIVSHEGTYYMAFKDERFGHVFGERRSIRIAKSPSLDGPYTVCTESITPTITEGPAVRRLPHSGRWCLLYDYCMDNAYGASVSVDLLNWEAVEDASFPPEARHGSICPVTEEELKLLLERYG